MQIEWLQLHKQAETVIFDRQPRDGLPVLMMADQKGKTMNDYRIITEEGNEIMRANEQGCVNYWNACNGIYEDENGEHYIYIQAVK